MSFFSSIFGGAKKADADEAAPSVRSAPVGGGGRGGSDKDDLIRKLETYRKQIDTLEKKVDHLDKQIEECK